MFLYLTNGCMARNSAPHQDPAARALAALLRDIVASARQPLDAPDMTDAVAIHDFRKAFKRWRALMRLIGPVIGEEAEALRIEARDIAREMASARDGQAALEALADLGDEIPSLSARSRATIQGRLAQLGASAEAALLTPALKVRIGDLLSRGATAVERWPTGQFDCREATRQLTATYRRVRDSEPKDWPAAPADHLHRLRQRIVEHRYQMELMEPAWPKLIKVWISESQRLRDCLGAHQTCRCWRGSPGRTSRWPIGAPGSRRRSPSGRPPTSRRPSASPAGCSLKSRRRSATASQRCGRTAWRRRIEA
jgi:CHAD domain-containing protein